MGCALVNNSISRRAEMRLKANVDPCGLYRLMIQLRGGAKSNARPPGTRCKHYGNLEYLALIYYGKPLMDNTWEVCNKISKNANAATILNQKLSESTKNINIF